ncbi:hypothetical protein FLA105534_01010 [Flavobacterium bizetiae]|uniref:Cell wall anchor protein n=1 Tax=Flavobacterium bizetiae TaxID=2704140 RepID=A0A6J4GBL7_9FLAO|nr:hypothetical protein [Flavobacterium bizetiae]CAA9196164.1 hypothetical protein FLA105534_01010 [Flavobacterium bizetiae]CAD5340575.1 hypothetical protein FLA105535_00530 [Flavobacterium bizetiae]CAD5346753.1 hypothetical protein FLA105534_00696 [Flavobacterium bizetiae]
MRTKLTLQNHKTFLLLFFFLVTFIGNAQIGIGTTTPDATSILDITSTTKGMLAPRMTTVQRNAIATPADGLMVYDIDLKTFYYYSTGSSSWLPIISGTPGRINFKRIKSTDNLAIVLATELANGGGSKYLLSSNTLYEINGIVSFNFPIDLNNAYVQGLDANDDIIIRPTGNIFEGANGGSIRGVTLTATAGNVFNLSGAATQNLIFRDCIVTGSSSVGTISGFGLVFLSIIQFSGNTNGITYNNITQLLLSNLGWFGNNTGTFEKLTGIFTLVEKQGGFSQVNTPAIGFDVSANPTISGDAVLESVVFTGSNTTGYIKPYTTGTYTGYNFNNNWNVRCAGIPTESDANAVGDFAIDGGTGFTTFGGANPTGTVKVPGTTTSYNLFRFSTDSGISNRLKYLGKKKRIFQISGSITSQSTNTGVYVISIGKNGAPLAQYKIYARLNGGLLVTDVVVVPINGTVELSNNDYVEIWIQRSSGSGDVTILNTAINIK